MIGYRMERLLRDLGASKPPRLQYGEHHLSHAAAAFLPSPFPSAAILTVDGIGEWSTAAVGHGVQHRVELLAEQSYPNSLGLLYTLATEWCGFEANDGEYKLMGLAPFGEPVYRDALAEIVSLEDDGSIEVDTKSVQWWGVPADQLDGLSALFDGPPRQTGAPISNATWIWLAPFRTSWRTRSCGWPATPTPSPAPSTCAWRAGWPSTASPMAGILATRDHSRTCGSSRPPGTPEVPWVPRCGIGTTRVNIHGPGRNPDRVSCPRTG